MPTLAALATVASTGTLACIPVLAERREGGLDSRWLVVAITVAVLLAVGARLVNGSLDRGRIGRYAQENGWQLDACRWSPFGPGWFGSRRERIYAVEYRDREGRRHSAYVKTSVLAGVYVTQDRVIDGGGAGG